MEYTVTVFNLAYNKNKLNKTLGYWPRDMLNFDFLEKALGIVSLLHFMYDFSTKMFLTLYSLNWPNFIAWLPLLLEILVNMCIAIVCQPGCDVTNFEIKLILLIKPFFYMTKNSKRNFKKNQKISWERKEFLRWNKKHFSSFLKGFQLPKIALNLRVRL